MTGEPDSLTVNGNTRMDLGSLDLNQSLEMMFIEPKWSSPKSHASSNAPICLTCDQLESPMFNIQCDSCRELLFDPKTSISSIFAILRQWAPQTQLCIELLVKEILKRGANVNDKDGLTDMTMLHYACKAGSSGVGDVRTALRTVHLLLSKNADYSIRCRWTDMAAIHYAVYFDVSEIVDYLLTISERKCIDDICRDFDGGTPLHIAAANLCIDSVKVLLRHCANVLLKDNSGKTALDCVPDPSALKDSDVLTKHGAIEVATELRMILETATLATIPGENVTLNGPVSGKVILEVLDLNLGDRVVINGIKSGILRFCGTTQFSPGIWAGVELDEPEAKHDGTIHGVTYFKCAPNRGIFAPISRICKFEGENRNGKSASVKSVNHRGVDISHVGPKIETGINYRNTLHELMCLFFSGLSAIKCKSLHVADIGDRVTLTDKRQGIVRFLGETSFAPGIWYGIELFRPVGKNDGSVQGIRYFTCKPNHGLFSTSSRISSVCKAKDKPITDDESECSLNMSPSSSERAKSPSTLKRLKSRSSLKVNSPTSSNSSSSWLTLGVNVLVNNEIGIVRYIGPVDFADGTWLGVELRSANGKNDGSVQGKRYFTCKPNKGLIVRPKRVSVRGINGAKLLP